MRSAPELDINNIKSAYFIGIKGSAMAALAEIFVAKGIEVSGSDTADVFYTDSLLKKIGVKVFEKFDRQNIPSAVDLIVHSTAYNKKNNPEVAAALKANFLLLSYPVTLGLFFNRLFGIAVCGTHGKTTTAAMLAEILRQAGLKPTALVGSKVNNWGSASLSGTSQYFVIEADEYQNKLKHYFPNMVVNTNIDYDHPDFFKTQTDYFKAFQDFFRKIPAEGTLIFNAGDKNSTKAARRLKCRATCFGKNQKADFKMLGRKVLPTGGQSVEAGLPGGKRLIFNLKLAGEYNALNALAAIAAASRLGIKSEQAVRALENFESSERRLQKIKNFKRGVLYDDYAHHPQEIKATIEAVRERHPRQKIIIAFHPHTFSRTKKFFKAFAQTLALADKVYVLDIYSSAREKISEAKFNAEHLSALVNKLGGKAEFKPTIEELAPVLKKEIGPKTVFISMGAGDIWKVHELIK